MRVLIWVQHLLGTGHTVRAAALARAINAAGGEATLVLGATPPPTLPLDGLATVPLCPVRATDETFRAIETADGTPYAAVAKARTTTLLATIERVRPDVMVTETFPFGRRAFAAELDPALAAARAQGAKTAASIRDVLVRKPPHKERAMAGRAKAFDTILVHGDPAVVRLEESFGPAPTLGDRLAYTGYIDAGPNLAPPKARAGVVVSAGGSAVGVGLIEAAIAAAPLVAETPMRILAPAALIAAHGWQGSGHLTIEPNRPDFRALLAMAAVSVSQAGYNTIIDVLTAGPQAILVPFAAGEETEQADRAAALAARGRATVLPEHALTPPRLAGTIGEALAAPPPAPFLLNTDGAAASAAILKTLAASR
ncbi:MAG: glycosyltransferase [Pseudomonadota bacterium]